jgi:predicted extracellular nuclease
MKNKLYMLVTGFFILSMFSVCLAQRRQTASAGEMRNVQVACVAFYNLENLFDTIPNQASGGDLEYTPDGANKWNTHKYNEKLRRMSFAISQIGLDQSPVGAIILGVAEIENRSVLEDLVSQPAIANRQYGIVHYDGPDRRGIDCALLYNPRFFTVSNSVAHPFLIEGEPNFRSRDQLLVSGYLFGEKIHVIVAHWPSRWGGEAASRPRRVAAAELTMSIIDSINRVEPNAKIIFMGDLNDDPDNVSVAVTLNAKRNAADVQPGGLFNPMWAIHDRGIGTLSYQGQWNLFDQIIISYSLLNAPRNELRFWRAEVFNRDFLKHQEGRDRGIPLRTHSRGVWLNGFSDHFPSLIYLVKEVE